MRFSAGWDLVFKAESPLLPGDLVLPDWSMSTVGLAHVDRSTDDSSDDSPWSLELLQVEVKAVMPTTTDLEVLVYDATASDVRIDRIAYQLDLLVYRQRLNRPKPRWLPWKTALADVTRLARH